MVTEKKNNRGRWAENTGELFEDHRNVMERNFDSWPSTKMKKDKATLPNNISVELLKALGNNGIDKIATLLHLI